MSAVVTNIITGFLGAGKTTAILHLLKHKPVHERWAVLVNEIGVDGSLLQGQYSEKSGVFIREVPGGCMCCADPTILVGSSLVALVAVKMSNQSVGV